MSEYAFLRYDGLPLSRRFVNHGRLTQPHCLCSRDGVPLITVANHASCLDDPGITSLILPWAVRSNADLLRWTVCTEELCFYHPGTSSFFGAGNAVPIQRGGSLYQKGLATLQAKLNEGRWVHLYAEGRVWQEQGLPLRDEEGRWCS